jgi:hypothetical protein
MGGFKQSQEDVLFACRTVFLSLVQTFSRNKNKFNGH